MMAPNQLSVSFAVGCSGDATFPLLYGAVMPAINMKIRKMINFSLIPRNIFSSNIVSLPKTIQQLNNKVMKHALSSISFAIFLFSSLIVNITFTKVSIFKEWPYPYK